MDRWMVVGILLVVFISGCIEENVPVTTTTVAPKLTTTTEEATTTTIEPTTTEEPETTTTLSKRECMFYNFQIKSHAYRNEELTLYFNNIGSKEINDFDVHLYYVNTTSVESFTDQGIAYHVTRVYKIDAGPGLDNVTVVEGHCGKSYYVNV